MVQHQSGEEEQLVPKSARSAGAPSLAKRFYFLLQIKNKVTTEKNISKCLTSYKKEKTHGVCRCHVLARKSDLL